MDRVREVVGLTDINRNMYTGNGVMVAVLDTGVARHPDISDRIVFFRDFINNRDYPYDDSGHGTHVCGIIGGDGRLSGGQYMGIAPRANFIVGKVLDRNGDGNMESMIYGLDWILSIQRDFNIRILNISVGIALRDKRKEYELHKRLVNLWDMGVIVICAAGNNGPKNGSISPIGMSEKMITVGCHDDNLCRGRNCCVNYSARGESLSTLRKPDVVAPGTDIISCNAFYKRVMGRTINGYIAKSGTSMATAVVSGAAAIMLEQCPWCEGNEFKRRITSTARDLGEAWNVQGWGMINIARLVAW